MRLLDGITYLLERVLMRVDRVTYPVWKVIWARRSLAYKQTLTYIPAGITTLFIVYCMHELTRVPHDTVMMVLGNLLLVSVIAACWLVSRVAEQSVTKRVRLQVHVYGMK